MHPSHPSPELMKDALDAPDDFPIDLTHHPYGIQNPIRIVPLLVLVLVSGRHVVFQVSAQVPLDDVVESLVTPASRSIARERRLRRVLIFRIIYQISGALFQTILLKYYPHPNPLLPVQIRVPWETSRIILPSSVL